MHLNKCYPKLNVTTARQIEAFSSKKYINNLLFPQVPRANTAQGGTASSRTAQSECKVNQNSKSPSPQAARAEARAPASPKDGADGGKSLATPPNRAWPFPRPRRSPLAVRGATGDVGRRRRSLVAERPAVGKSSILLMAFHAGETPRRDRLYGLGMGIV